MPAFLTSLLTAASAVMLGPNGTWDLRAGDQTLFRIEIKEEPGGPVATWDRPERFQTNGEIFSHIEGPTVRRQTRNIRVVNSDLEISFDDPGSDPTVLRLHPVDAGHAELSFQGAPFEPLPLVKAQAGGPPIGPWDSGRSYVPTVTRPTNAEMTAIFDADQADRQSPDIDWSAIGPVDYKRRNRWKQLLDTGALQSGDDYYHAAFVFQHGNEADDYLLAHVLAMIAVARGRPDAVWIASATLDRYLQAIDKPQIFGTQYTIPEKGPVTQEPFDRALISNAMRKALRVPTLEEQEKRLRAYGEKPSTPHKP
jgi:hypothetical protein